MNWKKVFYAFLAFLLFFCVGIMYGCVNPNYIPQEQWLQLSIVIVSFTIMGVIYLDLYDREEFDKGDLYYSVPVVSVEWLETHITLAKGLLSKVKPTDRFNAGEISGRIEALEILLSSARKEAEKK